MPGPALGAAAAPERALLIHPKILEDLLRQVPWLAYDSMERSLQWLRAAAR
jgi:hypothetical protein